MKKILLILALLSPLAAFGQSCPGTVTPKLGLCIPNHGIPNWDMWINPNWTKIDNITGGGSTPAAPAFSVQFANITSTALQSDPTVTINPTTHTFTGPISLINGQVTVYPEWYGAQGNGIHDDTAAIQAAIASCPATQCAVKLSSKTYLITGQLTFTGLGKSLIGDGYGSTQISCQPTGSITACVQAVDSPLFTIKDIRIAANFNATYCLEHTLLHAGSAEHQVVDNVFITGCQYGWAIGPDTHNDIAHVNGYAIDIGGSAVADVVIGDGTQGNVLDNNCYGCTFDVSQGDGVQWKGGGFNVYGGGTDENAGIDFHLINPPDQALVVSGVRSEGSAQFFKEAQSGTYAIPGITLSYDTWYSGPTPNTCGPIGITVGPCAVIVSSTIPTTIIGGKYTSIYGTVEMNFHHSVGNPVPITMIGVAVSNPNWAATLQAMSVQGGTSLFSTNDSYINPSTFVSGPGSGYNYSTSAPVYVSPTYNVDSSGDLSVAGSIVSGSTISNIAGGFGLYSNMLKYSAFDSGAVGSSLTWDISCTAFPPTTTSNTTDVVDPAGGNHALKMVSGPTVGPQPGCPSSYTGIQQLGTASTVGPTYTVTFYACGAVGGEGIVYGPLTTTGYDAGATLQACSAGWKRLKYVGPVPNAGNGNFITFDSATTNATIYVWGAQMIQASAPGLYAHTTSAVVAPTLGFLNANGDSLSASTLSTVVDTSTPVTVSTTLGAEQHFNENATAAAAVTYNLPTAAAGKQFCFSNAYNGSAANTGTLELLTSASGQYIIFTDGTLSATGGYVISGGAARDSACVIGVDSTHWALYVQAGTWTKH